MPIVLTNAQTRFLRGQAHGLKAILQVGGKGISPALVAEVDNALEHHELIKVKIAAEDREARDAMIAELAKRSRRRAGAAHRPYRDPVPARARTTGRSCCRAADSQGACDACN